MDFERDLNTAQRQAVLTTEGPVLVIAGAGSGKTRTIVYRLAHLVSQGVDPGSILLLTFTRKAAQEMLTRAEPACWAWGLSRHFGAVAGGTFHAFSFATLRRFHPAGRGAVLQGFTIMDRADSEDVHGPGDGTSSNLGKGDKSLSPAKGHVLEMLQQGPQQRAMDVA